MGRDLHHGYLEDYEKIIEENILPHVANGKSKILVIGAGKSPTDDVTKFWNDLKKILESEVDYVNEAKIASTKLDHYALVVVVSDEVNTPRGGLTVNENKILIEKKNEFKDFINNGGGLLGFASSFINSTPYGYLPVPEGQNFKVEVNVSDPSQPHRGYSEIKTIKNNETIYNDWEILETNFSFCCWHDNFLEFPDYLDILALNVYHTNKYSKNIAVAVGGAKVIIDNEPPVTTIGVEPVERKGKNGWFNQQDHVYFTLKAVDKYPGVYQTKYRINNGNWMNYSVGAKIPVNIESSSYKN